MKKKGSKFQDEFMAAAIGDLEWLKQSLREKFSFIDFDENGLAAIHLCSIHGRFECLKYLIEDLKVDVNLPSAHGWRPLHLCINNKIGKKAIEIMLYLMHRGALLSSRNDDGLTPVHQAASEGHMKCLRLLIEAGAEFTILDNRNNRPIDLAKIWGHKECAKLLATHSWHKEKAFIANEKFKMKKCEIRQILLELEGKLETSEKDKYRGSQAFVKWLEENTKETSINKKQEVIAKETEEGSEKSNISKNIAEKKNKESNLNHSSPWNPTVRPTETFSPYPGSLRDLYPRHPITLQPFTWSTPTELNPKCKEPLSKLLIEKDQILIRKAAQERDKYDESKLPKILISQQSHRNMFYKTDSVTEIPTKKVPKSAALQRTNDSVFCFTNDIDSELFRSGLNMSIFNDECSCPSTASTDIGKYMNDTSNGRCYSVDIMSIEH